MNPFKDLLLFFNYLFEDAKFRSIEVKEHDEVLLLDNELNDNTTWLWRKKLENEVTTNVNELFSNNQKIIVECPELSGECSNTFMIDRKSR